MSHLTPETICLVVLLVLWCIGEFVLLRRRRTNAGVATEDRHFVRRAKVGLPLISVLVIAGWLYVPAAAFGNAATFIVGLVLMALGLALRWWAILHLGSFFTIDVAVAVDHRVIDSGPYRLIRHPSYAGILLGTGGLALCIGNAVSGLVILSAAGLALSKRIEVEEAALSARLGDSYRDYARRTKRLIPSVF